jgi:hypothetical protein
VTDHFEYEIRQEMARRSADRVDPAPWTARLKALDGMPGDYVTTVPAGDLRDLVAAYRYVAEVADLMAQWAVDNADRAAQYQKWHTDVQADFTAPKGRLYDRIEVLEAEVAGLRKSGQLALGEQVSS